MTGKCYTLAPALSVTTGDAVMVMRLNGFPWAVGSWQPGILLPRVRELFVQCNWLASRSSEWRKQIQTNIERILLVRYPALVWHTGVSVPARTSTHPQFAYDSWLLRFRLNGFAKQPQLSY
jgi:hypothetical protein